jgi:hypothetical protein
LSSGAWTLRAWTFLDGVFEMKIVLTALIVIGAITVVLILLYALLQWKSAHGWNPFK